MATITICRELRGGYFTRRAYSARLKGSAEKRTLPQAVAANIVTGESAIHVRPDHIRLVCPYLEIHPSSDHAAALFNAGIIGITPGPGDHPDHEVDALWLLQTAASASLSKLKKEGFAVKLAEPPFSPGGVFRKLVTRPAGKIEEARSAAGQMVECAASVLGFCGAGQLFGELRTGIFAAFVLLAGAVYGSCAGVVINNTAALLYRLARFPGDLRTYTSHLFGGEVPQTRLKDIEARLHTL